MHSFTLLSAVTVALIPASHAATYFVAANCEPKYGGITTGSFPEAWAMASNVQAKVDANDAGEAIAYDKLFKGHTPKSDVLDYFKILGGLTQVSDPSQADIIYDCDNEDETTGRWKPIMDGNQPRQGQFKDETYHVRTERTLSCRANRAIMTTYGKSLKHDGWKDDRTVISVCDKLMRSYGGWATVSKFEDRLLEGKMVDPNGKEQNVPSILDNPCTSRTILHEAFHSNLIKPHKSDVAKSASYGWKAASTFDAGTQFNNADNFAVYAFSMFLKGYQLGSTDEQKTNGELVRINAATKRAVYAIRNLPSKCRNWIYRRGSKRCGVEASG